MEIKQTKQNMEPTSEVKIKTKHQQSDFYEHFESILKPYRDQTQNVVLYSKTADGKLAASMMAYILNKMEYSNYKFICVEKPSELKYHAANLILQLKNNSKVFLLDCVNENYEEIFKIFEQSENNLFVINFEKDIDEDTKEVTKSVSRKVFDEFKFEYHEKVDIIYGALNAIESVLNYHDWVQSETRIEKFGIVKMIEDYDCTFFGGKLSDTLRIFDDVTANKTYEDFIRIGFIVGKTYYNETLAKLKYTKISEFACVGNLPLDNYVRLFLEFKGIDTEFYVYQNFSIDGKQNTITFYHLGLVNMFEQNPDVIYSLHDFCMVNGDVPDATYHEFLNFDKSVTVPASIICNQTIFSIKTKFNDFMENLLCPEEVDDEDVQEDVQEDIDKLNELSRELYLKQKYTKRDTKCDISVCVDPVETTIKSNMKPNIKPNIDISSNSGKASNGCILIDITEVPQESYFQMLCNIFKILTNDSEEHYEKYESIFDVNKEPSTNKIFLVIDYPQLYSLNNKFDESAMVPFVNEVLSTIIPLI